MKNAKHICAKITAKNLKNAQLHLWRHHRMPVEKFFYNESSIIDVHWTIREFARFYFLLLFPPFFSGLLLLVDPFGTLILVTWHLSPHTSHKMSRKSIKSTATSAPNSQLKIAHEEAMAKLSPFQKERQPAELIQDPELEVTITPELMKQFSCPICLNLLKDTLTTKNCLHRFCKGKFGFQTLEFFVADFGFQFPIT